MGLLDQKTIAEQVLEMRWKRVKEKERRALQKKIGKIRKTKRPSSFKKNVPKKLRKEWGDRMNHLRSIQRES